MSAPSADPPDQSRRHTAHEPAPAADRPGASRLPSASPADWLARHGDALYRYALLHVGNSATAEDLVQDTLLAAIQAAGGFQQRSSQRTWLIGILRHKLMDHFRRTLHEPTAEDAPAGAADYFSPAGKWRVPPQRWPQAPQAALEREEFWRVLGECLQTLSPRAALAFCQREMQEMDSDEVCKLLEVTPTNLWTLLHRARIQLRHCLEMNWFRKGRADA